MQGAISLQQKMGRIAPYTQRYSAPQRLHPPVACGDSPPWQGGPRGLSGPANKVRNDTFSNKTIGLSIPFSKRKVRQTDFLLIQANIAQPCEQRRASCLPLSRGGGPPKAVEGWLRCKKHYRNDRTAIYVSTPQSRLRRARRINVRCRALDLTEVSPGHFDPLGKGGREVRATPQT